MTAALGKPLVFELHGGCAGRFELDDRSLDVEGLAKSCVGIDDERQGTGAGEEGCFLDKLREREQADVGEGENTGGEGRAREVHGVVAALLDEAGEECTGGAGDRDGGVVDELAEAFAG